MLKWLDGFALFDKRNFKRQKIKKKNEVSIGDTKIESKNALKYLGMIIGDRLNFKEHVKFISEKASATQGALTRMMPDIGGPNLFKRRIK